MLFDGTSYSSLPKGGVVEETPLIEACKNGNLNELKRLVKESKIDINQQGSISTRHAYSPMNGSALHAAVVAGQLEVVNYLVGCCQLDINAKTKAFFDHSDGGSTALHLAVSELFGHVLQKEIIACLLEHGADWAITNDCGDQCWELTFDPELMVFLMHLGVGLDPSRNAKSHNIAHLWAGSLRSLDVRSAEVVALAIDKGIDINKPALNGCTPLMIAAVGVRGKPNVKVVESILEQKVQPISLPDQINALELMGATFISDGQLENGIKYLKMAMERRASVETGSLLAESRKTWNDEVKIAFKTTNECQTIKELEEAALDSNLLKVQAHLIRIRVLGVNHTDTINCLTNSAFSVWYKEPQTFLNYLHLILNGLESTKTNFWLFDCSILVALSLVAITLPSDSMAADEVSTFNNAMPILRKLVSLLNSSSGSNDLILSTIVNLAHVMLHHKPLTLEESVELKNCLQQAVSLQKRDSRGCDLFLIACRSTEFSVGEVLENYGKKFLTGDDSSDKENDSSDEEDNDDDEIKKLRFRRIVSAKTISLFIEVGSDVNSVSKTEDTGLHILAKSSCSYECIRYSGVHSHASKLSMHSDAYTSSIRTLYEAGIKLDQINSQGKTVADILSDHGIELESLLSIPTGLL